MSIQRNRPPKDSASGRVFFRKGDLWLIGAVFMIVAALLFVGSAFSDTEDTGKTVVVTTPAGEQTLLLSKDVNLPLEGTNGIHVMIQVEKGRVRFASSDCPDRICVHSGWLSKAGQVAACVPAGISLRVTGGNSGVDAVAG